MVITTYNLHGRLLSSQWFFFVKLRILCRTEPFLLSNQSPSAPLGAGSSREKRFCFLLRREGWVGKKQQLAFSARSVPASRLHMTDDLTLANAPYATSAIRI